MYVHTTKTTSLETMHVHKLGRSAARNLRPQESLLPDPADSATDWNPRTQEYVLDEGAYDIFVCHDTRGLGGARGGASVMKEIELVHIKVVSTSRFGEVHLCSVCLDTFLA